MIKVIALTIYFVAFSCVSYAYSPNDFLVEMDEPGLCALTFDDGPSRYTPMLLDMMSRENVKATFFVLGENALNMHSIISREIKEGHEVANHSWSHPNLGRSDDIVIRFQIAMTNAVLNYLGVSPRFFRPPYGSFTPSVEKLANEFGMEIALWSHDSYDWKRLPQNYSELAPRQKRKDRHGVFLFHDIHQRTVNDFPRIVSQLRASGCTRFVTLSEYMSHRKRRITLANYEHYIQCKRFFLLSRNETKNEWYISSSESKFQIMRLGNNLILERMSGVKEEVRRIILKWIDRVVPILRLVKTEK